MTPRRTGRPADHHPRPPAADLLTIESQTASEADSLTDTDTRPPAADLLTVATADSIERESREPVKEPTPAADTRRPCC